MLKFQKLGTKLCLNIWFKQFTNSFLSFNEKPMRPWLTFNQILAAIDQNLSQNYGKCEQNK